MLLPAVRERHGGRPGGVTGGSVPLHQVVVRDLGPEVCGALAILMVALPRDMRGTLLTPNASNLPLVKIKDLVLARNV